MGITESWLIDILTKLIVNTSIQLPDDVIQKLQELSKKETSGMARVFYDAMLKDIELAKELNSPCCQDTGILQFYIKIGTGFPLINEIEECVFKASLAACSLAPLRPNVIDPFTGKNTGNNVGCGTPLIDYKLMPNNNDIEIYLYMAGGGCSMPGAAKVFLPIDGFEAIIQFVFEQICSLGINACPPLLIGVGVANSADIAAKLSKQALLRPVGSLNPNSRAAAFERMLETKLNELKIGPGGITGSSSVLGVHVEYSGRHPATLAAGISIACWAHRRSAIKINSDGDYELSFNKGVVL